MILSAAGSEQGHERDTVVAVEQEDRKAKSIHGSDRTSMDSIDSYKRKSVKEEQQHWKVRGRTVPVSAAHLVLFAALLLASAASRLEIFPRAQTYTDVIDFKSLHSDSAMNRCYRTENWVVQNITDPTTGEVIGAMGDFAHIPIGCRDSKMGAYILTFIIPWFAAAWWAAISDKVGRKPVLMLSTLGVMIAEIPIITVLVMGGGRIEHVGAGKAILGLGAVFHSLLGGFLTNAAVSFAYLVDTTTRQNRTIVIALGLFALYIGNFIGASIGHTITSQKWTFITAIIMQAVYVLYVLVILPESHTAAKRQEARDGRLALKLDQTPNCRLDLAKTIGEILLPISALLPTKLGNGTTLHPGCNWDFNVFFLSTAFGIGSMMIDGAYFLGPPTIWPSGQDQYSAYWFIPRWRTYSWRWYPLARALILLVMTPGVVAIVRHKTWKRLVKRNNGADPETLSNPAIQTDADVSDQINQNADLKIAFVATLWTVFLQSTLAYAHPYGTNEKVITIVGAFGVLFMPTLVSLISVLYTNNGGTDIGRLMGGLTFLQAALGQGLGKWIFAIGYDKWYTSFVPGAYYLATGLMAVLLVAFYHIKLPNQYFN